MLWVNPSFSEKVKIDNKDFTTYMAWFLSLDIQYNISMLVF